ADNAGNFSFNLSSLAAGSYSFIVYANDAAGLKSPNLSFEQAVASGVKETISGLVIPPTLKASHRSVKQGQSLTLSGYTQPNRSITLYFSGSSIFIRPVQSSDSGSFAFALDTAGMNKGGYSVYAGQPNSAVLQFSIGDETVLPPTGPCVLRSDLNCDGR